MVVAQLVERSLPTPEVCGSNPVIGKKYIEDLLSTVLIRRKEKEKRPGMAHLKNILYSILLSFFIIHLGSKSFSVYMTSVLTKIKNHSTEFVHCVRSLCPLPKAPYFRIRILPANCQWWLGAAIAQ